VLGELVDERTLAGAGGAGESEDAGLAAVREERLEQVGGIGRAILDRADGTRERAGVAGAQALNPGLEVGVQTLQCKGEGRGWETRVDR
jgi:hypothetical protein